MPARAGLNHRRSLASRARIEGPGCEGSQPVQPALRRCHAVALTTTTTETRPRARRAPGPPGREPMTDLCLPSKPHAPQTRCRWPSFHGCCPFPGSIQRHGLERAPSSSNRITSGVLAPAPACSPSIRSFKPRTRCNWCRSGALKDGLRALSPELAAEDAARTRRGKRRSTNPPEASEVHEEPELTPAQRTHSAS